MIEANNKNWSRGYVYTVRFILYLSALCCSNVVLLVCQGERGPVGPAAVGPRGVPGIPGERGESVSVAQSLLLFS